MTDLSDIGMDGVKPMSDAQELGVGKYFVRIEDTEKKATKDRFDEQNNKLPPNHYLQIALKVYGGDKDGHTEFVRLNLWNTNDTAVNMAKSELKSIQNATKVATANSNDFHGKWMLLEVTAGIKDPTKLYKHYEDAPVSLIDAYKHIPPVPAKMHTPATASASVAAASAPAAAASKADEVPAWAAQKKA